MIIPMSPLLFALLALALVCCACSSAATDSGGPGRQGKPVIVQYLEIVTPDVDATCKALERLHGVSFGDPDPGLGQARTATLVGGGRLGVRAPMRPDEAPVVRPYVLVDDIGAAVKAAEAAGAQIALPPMEIPGQGKFAIYIQGGIDHGLWEL